jgi:GTP cyclohydrolase II
MVTGADRLQCLALTLIIDYFVMSDISANGTTTVAAVLPTRYGEFQIRVFADGDKEHVALIRGDLQQPGPVLARLHSECLTGDALFSLRCDCGFQLEAALSMIAAEGRGVLLYLRQEGRGIGLTNKIRAYDLQDHGQDTVEANESLGFGADQRDYSCALAMLTQLGITSVKLMTNNPRKVQALREAGVTVVERVPMKFGANPHNQRYLQAKSDKLGHLLKE